MKAFHDRRGLRHRAGPERLLRPGRRDGARPVHRLRDGQDRGGGHRQGRQARIRRHQHADTLRWTYKKKTFDPDNQSLVDDETILIFQKDASGKFKVVQVIFG